MFFIQVVRGRPGGRLQFSGGGSKMAWLASAFSSIHAKKVRRRDFRVVHGWVDSWIGLGRVDRDFSSLVG